MDLLWIYYGYIYIYWVSIASLSIYICVCIYIITGQKKIMNIIISQTKLVLYALRIHWTRAPPVPTGKGASDWLLSLMLVARGVFRVKGHGVNEARTSCRNLGPGHLMVFTMVDLYPMGSMYGIYANIWGILMLY